VTPATALLSCWFPLGWFVQTVGVTDALAVGWHEHPTWMVMTVVLEEQPSLTVSWNWYESALMNVTQFFQHTCPVLVCVLEHCVYDEHVGGVHTLKSLELTQLNPLPSLATVAPYAAHDACSM